MLYRGGCRFVWVIGNLAIKFPQVRPIRAVKWIWKAFRTAIGKLPNPEVCTRTGYFKLEAKCAIEDYLVRGFRENIGEARFYLATRHPLVARLYFACIIFNVYRRERGVGKLVFKDERQLIDRAKALGGTDFSYAVACCGHTLDRPGNFSWDSEQVKILDYGEWQVQELVSRYGNQLPQLLLSIANEQTHSSN
jgi:hypothetical protein